MPTLGISHGSRPTTVGSSAGRSSAPRRRSPCDSSRRGKEPPDERALIKDRLDEAARFRASLAIDASAFRLLHGEADRLPATIVDQYGDETGTYFVVQTLSQAADRRLALLCDLLVERFNPRGVLARNDPKVRELEGLPRQVEVLYGEVPERVVVREGLVRYAADLRAGQKTGLFLDQRENHAAAATYARGDVLDAFTYHGGFCAADGPARDVGPRARQF
jgi:23S rRNA (cytosine1962-C5)-methyltransferase